MTDSVKKPWLRVCYCFLALLFLAAGFLFLKFPIRTEAFVGYIYVCFFTATGVMQIITYLAGRKEGVSGWILALGIIDVLIGIYFLCHVKAMIGFMPMFLAIWAVITGFTDCLMALQAKGEPGWGWSLALGGLLLVIGIVMFFDLATAMFTVAMLLSIAMFILAIQYFVKTFTR